MNISYFDRVCVGTVRAVVETTRSSSHFSRKAESVRCINGEGCGCANVRGESREQGDDSSGGYVVMRQLWKAI